MDVAAVFVGAHHSGNAEHPWSARCVAAVPGLVPVASAPSGAGMAEAFLVRAPVAEAPTGR
jgi:hypothetical protein